MTVGRKAEKDNARFTYERQFQRDSESLTLCLHWFKLTFHT